MIGTSQFVIKKGRLGGFRHVDSKWSCMMKVDGIKQRKM